MVEKLEDSSSKHRIDRLSFRILSPDQIENISVATLDNKTLYDIESRKPFSGGPLDLRLGVSTKTGICSTCKENIQNCAGHFGQIKLVLPCFHIGFLKQTISVLNCICKSCGSLLLPFNRKIVHSQPINFESIKNECKNAKSCPKCQSANGTVKKNSGFRIYHEIKNNKGEHSMVEINPQTCLNLFNLVDEEDYPFLGLRENPANMIIQNLAVPPSCIRPSVDMQEEGFNEDDLTVKLSEIINTNKLLEESIRKGNSLPIINEDWDYLQLQVNLLINSDLPSINMINTPIRGLVQRLKGKSGRFRCNLSGKRVDFSGRTVISPDPNLSVEEVGVPIHIAKILTVPEKVNSFNRDFLGKMIVNGVEKWPGANYVISKDEKGKEFKRFLMYGKNKELKIGDVVERHLLNGDILLFNRQPSLHRMSIMAHKARIHNHRTLRFNECDCTPYNADFDGDEMNIHLPQTFEARTEAQQLMGVQHNICTARNNEPLISCTQDFLTGAYLLTSKNVFLTRQKFAQLCSYVCGGEFCKIRVEPAVISPVELFTGKQVFEFLIEFSISKKTVSSPNKINLKAKNRSFKDICDLNDSYVEILNNRFIRGRLDKSIIGGENRKGSLIYQFLKISKDSAVAAMDSTARLTSRYMAEIGFSIGLDDVFPSQNLIKEKLTIIDRVYRQVDEFIKNKVPNIEQELSVLNKIREECGNVCLRELKRGNSPVIMQDCGSKGSKINVSQMIACVGQQIISGSRVPDGMINRTLPHFPLRCLSPESKGFVLNSFFSGLTGYEFFFHAVSGRVGLVDTAVKTAETGYMQRRLMKALEDLSVKYDYTVRNSAEDLVQFRYGEDGIQTLKNEDSEFFEWIFNDSVSVFRNILNGAVNKTDDSKNKVVVDQREHRGFVANEDSRIIQRLSMMARKGSFLNEVITYGFVGESFDITDFISDMNRNHLNNSNLNETKLNNSNETNNLDLNNRNETNSDFNFNNRNETNSNSDFNNRNELNSNSVFKNNDNDVYFVSEYTKDILNELHDNPATSILLNDKLLSDLVKFLTLKKETTFFYRGTFYRYFQNRYFIREFFNILKNRLSNMVVDPGTAVGAITGQSIGEPGTQMTLKTFHFAGIASMNITLGVPRLKEIINASANISTPIINGKLAIKGLEAAKVVKGRIEKIILKDLVSRIATSVSGDRITLSFTVDQDIINKLRLETSVEHICHTLNVAVKGCQLESQENTIRYVIKRAKENSFFNIEKIKKQLLGCRVCGLDGVNRVVINCVDKGSEEYELLIESKCFGKILNVAGIEPTTTTSNDILEVEKTLGIEAARTLIMNEVEYTMGNHGIKVDHRHIMLLADTMAFRGSILGITRFGIGKMRTSTLMLASFEQTADYLFNAAIKGVDEHIKGVSESIILGIPISLGTGSMKLLWKE